MKSALAIRVIDLVKGRPASGLKIALRRLGSDPALLSTSFTGADGRAAKPILGEAEFDQGHYELDLYLGDYFGERRFLDVVPIHIAAPDGQHGLEITIQCSPWHYAVTRDAAP